jgi:hypothetical protein
MFSQTNISLVSLPENSCVWPASPEAQFQKRKFLWETWNTDELKTKAREIEASGQLSIGLGGRFRGPTKVPLGQLEFGRATKRLLAFGLNFP